MAAVPANALSRLRDAVPVPGWASGRIVAAAAAGLLGFAAVALWCLQASPDVQEEYSATNGGSPRRSKPRAAPKTPESPVLRLATTQERAAKQRILEEHHLEEAAEEIDMDAIGEKARPAPLPSSWQLPPAMAPPRPCAPLEEAGATPQHGTFGVTPLSLMASTVVSPAMSDASWEALPQPDAARVGG
eukprot:TRINITY_DN3771_c0_g3_i1.p1 TRINITY_DN3771_c0_g3~~TRINITY_DN3771_c0_g3_i1.p1  ORF type:complete len:188 (+),score=44.57 TRINITY_DN3771_c0_g3_i1:34-597(+)